MAQAPCWSRIQDVPGQPKDSPGGKYWISPRASVAGAGDALLHVLAALERVERGKLLFRLVLTATVPFLRGLGLHVPALVELLPKQDALPHNLLLRRGLGVVER